MTKHGVVAWSRIWGGAMMLASAGCASTQREPLIDVPVEARHVVFRNLTSESVRVYLDGTAHGRLLGTVPPLASARLRLPTDLRTVLATHRLTVAGAKSLASGAVLEVQGLTLAALAAREWTIADSGLTGAPARAVLATAGGGR